MTGDTTSMTITATGQLTIPPLFQERCHLTPGTEVEFAGNEKGELIIRARVTASREQNLDSWLEMSSGLGSHWSQVTDEILQATRSEI